MFRYWAWGDLYLLINPVFGGAHGRMFRYWAWGDLYLLVTNALPHTHTPLQHIMSSLNNEPQLVKETDGSVVYRHEEGPKEVSSSKSESKASQCLLGCMYIQYIQALIANSLIYCSCFWRMFWRWKKKDLLFAMAHISQINIRRLVSTYPTLPVLINCVCSCTAAAVWLWIKGAIRVEGTTCWVSTKVREVCNL